MAVSNTEDKVVVITGASSGIGESTAKLLASRGAKVVLGARRKDRICAVVKEITGARAGLRIELHSQGIRCTMISPGAVISELQNGTPDPSSAKVAKDLYDKIGIPADSVAGALAYAVEQPTDVGNRRGGFASNG